MLFDFIFTTASSVTKTFETLFTSLGALCLIVAAFPALLQVTKTNQTYGFSKKLLFFGCCTATVFIVVSIFGICGEFIGGSKEIKNSIFDCVGIVANSIVFCCNAYLFSKKCKNMAAAKKAGMSEMDHYNSLLSQQTPTVEKAKKN